MSLRRRKAREAGFLDLTPCSDIVFSLLLFYILTQNFVAHLPLKLPRVTQTLEQSSVLPVRIEVLASGTILWNGCPLSPHWEDDLPAHVRGVASSVPVLILAHSEAPAGVAIELLDGLRSAGIAQVAFGGLPREEKTGNSAGATLGGQEESVPGSDQTLPPPNPTNGN